MSRRRYMTNAGKKLFIKRFFPAGNYTWTVPAGCTEVDVFLVGGGGGGAYSSGGGSGYTKTYKKNTVGWKDGNAISVNPGQIIPIIVGQGGSGRNDNAGNGGNSQFLSSTYMAEGGKGEGGKNGAVGGNGGSGGSAYVVDGLSDGGTDGSSGTSNTVYIEYTGGTGQGHTTRDFGEPTGKRNAGGGAGGGTAYDSGNKGNGGISDYTEGRGISNYTQYYGGGGGYGGGGSGGRGNGGDGTVLIRYWAYEE